MSSAMAEMGLFTPLIGMLLDASPFFLVCLAFTLLFLLIPNTKVRFRYAFLSGVICGISFQIVQLLFVNGQIYVSKYNAIYGSFAFLPLLLIWLQLSWLILLFGCMLTYSAQNVFVFNYADDIRRISRNYYGTMAVGMMAVIVRRQWLCLPPLSNNGIAAMYGVPVRLATFIADRLHHAGLIYFVMEADDEQKMVPAVDLSTFSVGALLTELDADGSSDFIVEFDIRNKELRKMMDPIYEARYLSAADKLLKDIEIAPNILANNKHKRGKNFKI
jgi:membrane protein